MSANCFNEGKILGCGRNGVQSAVSDGKADVIQLCCSKFSVLGQKLSMNNVTNRLSDQLTMISFPFIFVCWPSNVTVRMDVAIWVCPGRGGCSNDFIGRSDRSSAFIGGFFIASSFVRERVRERVHGSVIDIALLDGHGEAITSTMLASFKSPRAALSIFCYISHL